MRHNEEEEAQKQEVRAGGTGKRHKRDAQVGGTGRRHKPVVQTRRRYTQEAQAGRQAEGKSRRLKQET